MYNDILNLKNRLETLGIDFDFGNDYDGYYLIVDNFSIIQHKYSYGLELCDKSYEFWWSDPEAIQHYLTVNKALKIMGI